MFYVCKYTRLHNHTQTRQVRQENAQATLDAGNGELIEEGFPWPKASGDLDGGGRQNPSIGMASENGHRHANVWGCNPARHHEGLRQLSSLHPTLPSSALRGPSNNLLEHVVDAPVEIVGRQMASILRAVEAKVKGIQVRVCVIKRLRR